VEKICLSFPLNFNKMLYKNDVVYDLTRFPKEIKELEAFFHGKFPVKVVYPTERIRTSHLKHNTKPDKPASISFDLYSVVKTATGQEEWRYAERMVVDSKGNKKYLPKKFLYTGVRYLQRTDIELIYFLLFKSNYRVLSEEELKADKTLKQTKMPKLMFEDLVSDAEKKAEKKKIDTKISNLLYGEDFGLAEEKLRAIATAYGNTEIEDYSLAQVQNYLDNMIHSRKDGPDKFFDMVGDDDGIKTRVAITKVMKMGLLKHNDTKRSWFWQTGEKTTKTICTTPPNKSPMEAIYDYYQGDQSFRDDVQACLITKKPNVGKILEKVDDNGGADNTE